jgi:dTMP kinase
MSHLIVLEGLDGAGTTTQARRLYDYLASHDVASLLTRQPSDHPIGRLLRQFLAGEHAVPGREVAPETLALLFAADRVDHLQREVEPALAQGRVVVSDRWYHSSLAYQGSAMSRLVFSARLGESSYQAYVDDVHASLRWVRQCNLRGPGVDRPRVPDLTIFLQVDPEVCARRHVEAGRARELFDDLEVQHRVAVGYKYALQFLRLQGEHIEVVDGAMPVDDVAAEVVRLVSAYLLLSSEVTP